ncbi:hypothetical protein Tco_0238316 [Tanacetum coccineum]
MASNGNDQDAEYALSRLLQKGTVAEYQKEFEMVISRVTGKSDSLLASIYIFGLKPTLQRTLLWSNPTTLGEAFSLACIAEAYNLNEFSKEKDDAKPPVFINTVGNNSDNDSRISGSKTPAKEVVDSGIESEVVVGLPEEFQEGDMVDALPMVEQKSLENWKELDNESEDRKVERYAQREGEPTILATFGSDRVIVHGIELQRSGRGIRATRLLQRGTVAEYQKEFEMVISRVTGKFDSLLASIYIFGLKPTLQRELLWSNPTTLREAFSLAFIAEAHFEDKQSITDIAKRNFLNAEHMQQENQDNLNEFSEEKDDAKPPVFIDTVSNIGDNDSRISGSKTPTEEVVDNDIESEVVVGLPEEFQEGDMVDALPMVDQKSLQNWKELDNESKDRKVERDAKRKGEPTILATFGSDRGITIWDPRIKSVFQDDTLRARWFRRSEEFYALNLG